MCISADRIWAIGLTEVAQTLPRSAPTSSSPLVWDYTLISQTYLRHSALLNQHTAQRQKKMPNPAQSHAPTSTASTSASTSVSTSACTSISAPSTSTATVISTDPAQADTAAQAAEATIQAAAAETQAAATGGAAGGAEEYPHQIHGTGGPTATTPFLQDFNLVAEAAKRAQMAVVMRDMEGISL